MGARILGGQVQRVDFAPVTLEIIDLDDVLLVLLPDGDIDVLEHEIGAGEPQAREAAMLSCRLEAKVGKEGHGGFEVRSGGKEWD